MPIISAKRRTNDSFLLTGEIIGTCFSIGDDLMVTAGHIVKSTLESETERVVGLVDREKKFLKAAPIIEVERLRCDLAIVRLDFMFEESANWMHVLRWNRHPLSMFDQVKTLGYPHGLHNVDDRQLVIQRAMQGHIVSAPNLFKPIGFEGDPFGVYELSFQAPSAISGSPLLWGPNEPLISGLIIGNSISRMLVLQMEEYEEGAGEKTIIEQYESLAMGIAVRQTEIFNTNSDILGKTFLEYLEEKSLLVR